MNIIIYFSRLRDCYSVKICDGRPILLSPQLSDILMLKLVVAVDYSFNVSFSDMDEDSGFNEIETDCRCFLKKNDFIEGMCLLSCIPGMFRLK